MTNKEIKTVREREIDREREKKKERERERERERETKSDVWHEKEEDVELATKNVFNFLCQNLFSRVT